MNCKNALPSNFQEVLISWEIKLQKSDYQIDTIHNLLYLYSVSVEYDHFS